MTRTSSAALKGGLSMIFTGALVVGGLSSPALAKEDRPRGHSSKGQSQKAAKASPVVTEDNDADGVPNNVSDSGDNRHPSGKDRSVEQGHSGNQGRAGSDPDGNRNGGADKPGGPGGVDKHDQDGNNGCGNDDDFEDDNNGNCGGRRARVRGGSIALAHRDSTSPNASTVPSGIPGLMVPPASVLGIYMERPANIVDPAGVASLDTANVLGASLSRLRDPRSSLRDPAQATASSHRSSGPGGTLPHTGWGADWLAQLAIMLLGTGATVAYVSRRRPVATTTD